MIQKKFSKVDVGINVFLMILLFLTLIPFYNVVILSFTAPEEVARSGLRLVPKVFSLSSYQMLLKYCRLDIAAVNSFFNTFVGTFLNMLVTICLAYPLSKKDLPGRKIILGGIIFTMLFNGGLVPFYLNIKALGLIDSRFATIIPVLVNTFYLIILINHFKSLPASLEESAKIDGANYITILFKILLPISKATLAAITLFYAVDRWNEWWNALLFISDPKKYPMQLLIREMLVDISKVMQGEDYMQDIKKVYPEGIKMASIVVTTIPVMIVYPFLQKYFAKGVMIGSVKG